MPRRLTMPLVGLMPTIPQALAGGGSSRRSRCRPRAAPARRPPRRRSPNSTRTGCGPARTGCGLAAERGPAAGRVGGPEVGPLGQVGLADDHRPGRAQPGDQEGVARFGAEQGGRTRRGRHARHLDVVLDQHGNALERPPRAARGARRVAGRGLGGRGRVHRDDRVQGRVQPLDALQVEAGQRGGTERARGHRGLQAGQRGLARADLGARDHVTEFRHAGRITVKAVQSRPRHRS